MPTESNEVAYAAMCRSEHHVEGSGPTGSSAWPESTLPAAWTNSITSSWSGCGAQGSRLETGSEGKTERHPSVPGSGRYPDTRCCQYLLIWSLSEANFANRKPTIGSQSVPSRPSQFHDPKITPHPTCIFATTWDLPGRRAMTLWGATDQKVAGSNPAERAT